MLKAWNFNNNLQKIFQTNIFENAIGQILLKVDPLMPGGNKRSYVLKQTYSLKLQVCLSTHDLLLPQNIKELMVLLCLNN